jgi:TonB family protein
VQIRFQVTQMQRGASRRLWLARTLDVPKIQPIAFLASVVFHSFLLVMLAGGAAPSRETETFYEVSLEPPAEMAAPSAAPLEQAAAELSKLNTADTPYWIKIRQRIARRLQYPDNIMRNAGDAMVVIVRLEISPEGELLNADLVTPGVNPAIARLVLDAVRECEPFPPPNPKTGEQIPLIVLLPIRFVAV